jgi:hypothetical protein
MAGVKRGVQLLTHSGIQGNQAMGMFLVNIDEINVDLFLDGIFPDMLSDEHFIVGCKIDHPALCFCPERINL